MQVALPKGVTAQTLTRAFKEFTGIVGTQWASATQADRESYHDPFNPGDTLEFVSGGFVAPASVEQVQAVVKAAGQFGRTRDLPVSPTPIGCRRSR